MGFIILGIYVLMALIGPIFVPLDMTSDFANRYKPPSLEHPFVRLLWGGYISANGARRSSSHNPIRSGQLFAALMGTAMGIARVTWEDLSPKF